MKFVIVGYGRVGTRTAHILQSEGHEVVIVERDVEKVDRATEAGFRVVNGDGSEESTLAEAGIDEADAIGALTGDLNTNFSACMIGKEHGCRTVLRIDADYREEIYETYAADVDDIIYPGGTQPLGVDDVVDVRTDTGRLFQKGCKYPGA